MTKVDAIWCGYTLTYTVDGKEYVVTTVDGVRGRIIAEVHLNDELVAVEYVVRNVRYSL